MDRLAEKTIQTSKQEFTLHRLGLRKWMELEKLGEAIYEAAELGNPNETAEAIYKYLSAASASSFDFSTLPWYDIALLLAETMTLNQCHTDVPLLKVRIKKRELLPWDYSLREWYSMAHMLAAKYGWNIEYIAGLDPDDVFPLVQEILTDEQLQREWEWQRSEIAYPYNKATKTQEFKPLPRPEWMLPVVKQPKLIKWRKEWLPVGNVVDLSGMLNHDQKPN